MTAAVPSPIDPEPLSRALDDELATLSFKHTTRIRESSPVVRRRAQLPDQANRSTG